MKKMKFILIGIIALILLPSIFLILDRYIINPEIKGISFKDMKDIGIVLSFLFGVLIFIILAERKKSINKIND